MNYYLSALKKYAVFSGRASRAEYWSFYLINMFIFFILGFVEGFTGIFPETNESVLAGLYQLFIIIPALAVGVRRMHDVNKSGWFLVIPIYNLILTITEGTKGDNRFGSEPKFEPELESEFKPKPESKLESEKIGINV